MELRGRGLLCFLTLFLGLLWRGNGRQLTNSSVRLGKKSSDLEHLTRTFTVRGSDDGRVNVLETARLEEKMSRISEVVADSAHSTNQVGTRAEMSDFSEVLLSMSLLGKRVLAGVTMAKDLDEMAAIFLANRELEELTLCRALDKSAFDLEGCADIGLENFIVALNLTRHDSL